MSSRTPRRALEALIEKVQSFGGRVEALGQRAVDAAFGLEPVEDAPRRAAHAAMAMQRAVERDPRRIPAPRSRPGSPSTRPRPWWPRRARMVQIDRESEGAERVRARTT